MRCAAVHTASNLHLIDHIAPLSALLKMPLILTEEKDFDLASLYYPSISMECMPDLEHLFAHLSERFDVLFRPQHWAPHQKELFFALYKKPMRLVYCTHGQSDKGYAFPTLSGYAHQDIVLIYGDLFKTMLQELQIPANLVMTGNYRLSFYLRHKKFYDDLAEEKVFSRLPPNKKTLLYAPTWKDFDSSTSFFNSTSDLFANIPSHWNVLIKPHPFLEEKDPALFYRTVATLEKNPNILVISQFPPIYPLLARADAYLGDYSSVGYDFLFFQRPMFFLPTPGLPTGRLHKCGQVLKSLADLDTPQDFTHAQKALYNYAFGKQEPEEIICQRIFNHCAGTRQTAIPSR